MPSIATRFSPDVVSLTQKAYGSDSQDVLEALTKPVGTYYVRCNTLKISPDELRRKLMDKGLQVSQHPEIPEALGIRVDGPIDISPAGKELVVDKHTAESVLQGANVYAPGVIKCQSVHFGDPVKIISELGDILASGTALMSANDILTFRKGLAVRLEERRYKAPQVRELPEYYDGLLYPQSLAAMTTSRILNPQQDETILDLNCAPGGKLSHISQLMENSGKIIGLDRNAEKIASTRRTITRLGCSNVTVSIHDSRYADADFANLKPDRVLVDPPCSALGLRPKVYDLTSGQRVGDLAEYQKQFMKSASRIVKPGGVVVYSVCTYTPEECEEVVSFAERECGLHSIQQKPFIVSMSGQGLQFQRFHPVLDEIGYFIAKFERIAR
jgi:16S rRNA (cytosine967-C5)-methyltransferase